MIEKLKAELDRINQGCGGGFVIDLIGHVANCGSLRDGSLCPICQERKQTLKKVSLMWADEMLKLQGVYGERTEDERNINKIIEEMKEIKSLMEKA
jgi:hypothetical protein